jgi:hypothetical protein
VFLAKIPSTLKQLTLASPARRLPKPVPGELPTRNLNPIKSRFCYDAWMRDLLILFVHVIAILTRLFGPGGIRSVVAESVLVKHQLLILNRSRARSTTPKDCMILFAAKATASPD